MLLWTMFYILYSITEHSDITKDFKPTMSSYLLFSEETFGDAWLSNFFKNKITEYQVTSFQEAWVKKCIDNGLKEVWLCIDGSNDDCDAKEVNLSETGHSKSGTSGNIVSYMWAVSSKDGTPLTYDVYRGGRVDSKAIKSLIVYINSLGVVIKGIILDRGFSDDKTINMIREFGYPYVVMLKSNTYAHTEMIKKHGEELRLLKSEKMINRSGMYGVTERLRLFKTKNSIEAYVTLLYDSKNGIARVNTLTDAIKKELKKANEAVLKGDKPKINPKYDSYIKKVVINDYPIYVPNDENLQETIDIKGFSSIATSLEMSANLVDEIYTLRQASEKQYCLFKSQLGYDVLHTHSTSSWKNKFCIGFIASIIRNFLEEICFSLSRDTNVMIRELCQLVITQYPEKGYLMIHTENKRQLDFLKEIDVNPEDLDEIAKNENKRITNKINYPVHSLPTHEKKEKRGPGRPKGSKNLKPKSSKKKKSNRKPGRPKGAKNKKTIEKENVTKPKRGRPKKSSSKT